MVAIGEWSLRRGRRYPTSRRCDDETGDACEGDREDGLVGLYFTKHLSLMSFDVTPTSLAFIPYRDRNRKPRGSLAIVDQNIKISQVPGP